MILYVSIDVFYNEKTRFLEMGEFLAFNTSFLFIIPFCVYWFHKIIRYADMNVTIWEDDDSFMKQLYKFIYDMLYDIAKFVISKFKYLWFSSQLLPLLGIYFEYVNTEKLIDTKNKINSLCILFPFTSYQYRHIHLPHNCGYDFSELILYSIIIPIIYYKYNDTICQKIAPQSKFLGRTILYYFALVIIISSFFIAIPILPIESLTKIFAYSIFPAMVIAYVHIKESKS